MRSRSRAVWSNSRIGMLEASERVWSQGLWLTAYMRRLEWPQRDTEGPASLRCSSQGLGTGRLSCKSSRTETSRVIRIQTNFEYDEADREFLTISSCLPHRLLLLQTTETKILPLFNEPHGPAEINNVMEIFQFVLRMFTKQIGAVLPEAHLIRFLRYKWNIIWYSI